MSKFDTKELRNLFSQFPTGVTVITTRDAEGNPVGMTASSFNTVSIDPALILWSIDKSSHSLDAFSNCEHFAVNILSDQQIDTSNKFASRGQDKFAGLDYTDSINGSPLLPDALAQLQCKNWNVVEGGDHLIIIGEVIDFKVTSKKRPLVFSQGSYAQANPHNSSSKKQDDENMQNSFLNNHILYLLRSVHSSLSQEFYQRLSDEAQVTPEMWRIYTYLVDGNPLSVDELSNFVMQPKERLLDTLSNISVAEVTYNDEEVQLTSQGVKVALSLLELAEEYKLELSSRLDGESYQQMKDSLHKLC